VELGDKMKDFASAESGGGAAQGTDGVAADAVRALAALGYAQNDAEKAVRSALEHTKSNGATADVIRSALAVLQKR
jgi:Holliday junction resolvasome RuvABC DNA-binding subunit